MNLGGMFSTVGKVHKDCGKSSVGIFFDMVWCGLKYQAGYSDYALFEMYNMTPQQRSTVLTRGINNSLIKRFNTPAYTEEINNKLKFAHNFSDFLGRDFLDMTKASEQEIDAFISRHPVFVGKTADGMCGKGVEKIDTSRYTPKELKKYLSERKMELLEECIVQHDEMLRLHPYSVNTCRVITLHKNGKTEVAAAYLRIGNGKFVDNFNSGGMVVPIEEATGEIIYPALDKAGNLYDLHPCTQVEIKGFRIPMWDSVLDFVKRAALVVPQVGMVGWDVAVCPTGPVFVEGNNFPGHDIYGLPPHRTDNIGVLPKFQKAIERLEQTE